MERTDLQTLALTVLLFFFAFSGNSTVLEVDTLGDGGTNSLRDRVENDASPGDTVWVNVSGRIDLNSAIQVDVPLTILGPTPAHLTLDGQSSTRIFTVDLSGTGIVRIKNLRMVNGNSSSDPGGSLKVLNGNCRVVRCAIDSSYSDTDGGAIANFDTLTLYQSSVMSSESFGRGGGIYSEGALYIKRSTIASNQADLSGGGIAADTASWTGIRFATIVHNMSQEKGGGIASFGTDIDSSLVKLTIVDHNSASVAGPEVYNDDTLESGGYNLIPDTTDARFSTHFSGSDQFSSSATSGLGDFNNTLEKNGHGYKYFPLPDTSDAIEVGPTNFPVYGLDQRLAPRELDGDLGSLGKKVDAGAVEFTPYIVEDPDGTFSGMTLDDVLTDINNLANVYPPYYVAFDLPSGNEMIDNSIGATVDVPTVIDGWSQEGSQVPGPNDPNDATVQVSAGEPLVELNGYGSAVDGIKVTSSANKSVIRGLSIHYHGLNGVAISTDSVVVSGCHIGLDPWTGGTANQNNGIDVASGYGEARIGGPRHFQRNVFANAHPVHIYLHEGADPGTRIMGNLIGLGPSGVATLSQGDVGIHVENHGNWIGAERLAGTNIISGNMQEGVLISGVSLNAKNNTVHYNRIGTDYKGASPVPNGEGVRFDISKANRLYKNQISGNDQNGVFFDLNADSNIVRGNLIGTGPSGNSALANQENGIFFVSDAIGQVIGGVLHSDSSNVISGNFKDGIALAGSGHTINGNLIGTDRSGNSKIPNGERGIDAQSNGYNLIGGTVGQTGNLISGNGASGIRDQGGFLEIVGNYIGVDSTGQDTLGNAGQGVFLENPFYRTSIGEETIDSGNVIGGNQEAGILIENNTGYQQGHLVGNNFIGVDSSGSYAMGNLGAGIVVNGDSNQIGSPQGYGNHIAYNQGAGIRVDSSRVGNFFSRNRIHNNGGLGIDLNADGVTSNDASDSDSGPNELRNYPDLLNYSTCGGQTTVKFAYKGIPTEYFRIEYYKVPAGNGDPTGHGEGDRFLRADTILMGSTTPDTFTVTYSPVFNINPTDSLTAVMADMNGWSSSEFAENITNADPLTISLDSVEQVTCAGDSNGGIFVTLQGGVTPYTVTLKDSGYSNSIPGDTAYTGLSGGTYHAIVEDSSGCKDTLTTYVDEPDTLQATAQTLYNESCAGACDGAVYAEVVGGRQPYTIQWDSLGTGDTLYGDTVQGLCPGTYDLTVEDSTVCVANHGTTVSPGDTVVADVSNDTSVCKGDSVRLVANGGGTYGWTPSDSLSAPASDTTYAFPNATTNYMVQVDSAACTDTATVQVSVDTLPNASAGPDAQICTGDTALLTASGGVNYSWSPIASLASPSSDTTEAYPGSTQGYEVAVTDTNGCTAFDSAHVTVNALPTANAGNDTTICEGFPAQLGGSPTTNSANASFDWVPDSVINNPIDTSNPIAVPSDTTTFTLLVTDTVTNCTKQDSAVVNVAPPLLVDAGQDTTICKGDSVTLGGSPSASGGSGSFNYAWIPPDSLSSFTVSSPTAFPDTHTTYELSVVDNNLGCTVVDSMNLFVTASPSFQLDASDSLCNGDTAVLSASGGADQYYWSTGTWNDSITVHPSSDSLYTVQGTDTSTGCSADTSVLIEVFPQPSVILSGPDSICEGDTAFLDGVGATSYVWQDSSNGSSYSDVPDSTTLYWVEGSNVAGCSDRDSLTITVNPAPPAPVSSKTDFTLCAGDSVPVLGVDSNSYENRWYTQADPSGLIANGDSLGGVTLSGDTTYRYAALTNTSSGCTGPVLSFSLTRFDSSDVQVSNDTTICLGESVQLYANGGTSYQWSPAEGLDDSSIADPVASPEKSRTYEVLVSHSAGCQVRDSVKVDLRSVEACGLKVYNAFSPDGDGVNELWVIDGIRAYPENRVTIFNRWGDRVERILNYNNEDRIWDGTRSNGKALPSGTYYYVIELLGDEKRKLSGYVQITK